MADPAPERASGRDSAPVAGDDELAGSLVAPTTTGAALAARIDRLGRLVRHPLFWVGAREMAGVSVGMTAWAFMTGVAMVNSGMSTVEALAMTLLVYAGSAQLATIPLIAGAAPIWVIVATALCVNLRFVVFSLHLRDYFIYMPRLKRLFLGYTTGDLTYVLFVKRFPKPPVTEQAKRAQLAYLWGGNSINWVCWQTASIAGIFLGSAIPPSWGLGFAATLALLALTCALATTWLRTLAAVLAGIVACLTYALPMRLNIVVAIAVAVAVCMLLEPKKNHAVPGNHRD